MEMLLDEKQALIREKESLTGAREHEKRITLNFINAKLQLLNNRIAEARVIDLKEQPQNEIRFGSTADLQTEASGKTQIFQRVGVDEADISRGQICFLSPLAKALIN
ncbi:MAG TPA: GreA/GreB family elongation factor [Bacteroidales bacterium]|nr:GreA/GreB family elongation factor [Bacteroidales bacterium]